jgi:hypothetical protein
MYPGPPKGYYIYFQTTVGHRDIIPSLGETMGAITPYKTSGEAWGFVDEFLKVTKQDIHSITVMDSRFTVMYDRTGEDQYSLDQFVINPRR